MEGRGQGNIMAQKTNNSTEDLVENEESEYPVADPSQQLIPVE
jgi:hypothetical protein